MSPAVLRSTEHSLTPALTGLIADEDYSGIFVLHLLDRIPSADAPFRDVTLFRSYVLFAHRKKVDGRWEVSEDTVERGKLFELFGEPCRYLRRISRDSELRELLFKVSPFALIRGRLETS